MKFLRVEWKDWSSSFCGRPRFVVVLLLLYFSLPFSIPYFSPSEIFLRNQDEDERVIASHQLHVNEYLKVGLRERGAVGISICRGRAGALRRDATALTGSPT